MYKTALFQSQVLLACLILAALPAAADTNPPAVPDDKDAVPTPPIVHTPHAVPAAVLSNQPKAQHLRKTIDGRTNDWHSAPVWNEGGTALADPGFSIDIKHVYMTNDRDYLYVFLCCLPTIAERFKQQDLGGRIGDLYLDVDNDTTTGSTEADLGSFGYGNGYEIRISMDCGVNLSAKGRRQPFVACGVQHLDRLAVQIALSDLIGETNAWGPIMRQIVRRTSLWTPVAAGSHTSTDGAGFIAHGEDGVELAIPLALLGIVPGASIRLMLVEEARDFGMDGYGVRYHTLAE